VARHNKDGKRVARPLKVGREISSWLNLEKKSSSSPASLKREEDKTGALSAQLKLRPFQTACSFQRSLLLALCQIEGEEFSCAVATCAGDPQCCLPADRGTVTLVQLGPLTSSWPLINCTQAWRPTLVPAPPTCRCRARKRRRWRPGDGRRVVSPSGDAIRRSRLRFSSREAAVLVAGVQSLASEESISATSAPVRD